MRVVLDACVLYPPSLRDLLLTLAALDAFEARWSEEILDELRRNVVADNPGLDPDRFNAHTLGEMRRHFPEAMVAVSHDDIERLDNHPNDRHVAAVAIVTSADGIVTMNLKDFRSRVLDEAGIAVLTPGRLVEQVLGEGPEVLAHALRRIAARWTNPPRSPVELLDVLAAHPTMKRPMRQARAIFR
ncbi:MAG TPA: PIN domain-containing protein [Acidimicrobiales bacterium]|nr:PIN domain-containing protein [Acidimicrobiales bacterium]